MKTLTTLLTALLLTACTSTPEPQSKRQLIEQYRTEHGDNWSEWGEDTKREFKREIEQYE